MALYGDVNFGAQAKWIGFGDPVNGFVVHFTTAGTGQPTIDAVRTRGIVSITRTGVGTYDITLPWGLRHINVQAGIFAHPASAVLNTLKWSAPEPGRIITLTNAVISTGAAGDTTGVGWNVQIMGRAQ